MKYHGLALNDGAACCAVQPFRAIKSKTLCLHAVQDQ